MNTNDPKNTPPAACYLEALIRSEQPQVADQAREMELKVGDVITGMEGDYEGAWWVETRLTLLFIGQQCCVWKVDKSSKQHPEFRNVGEASNWTLNSQQWYRVVPTQGGRE